MGMARSRVRKVPLGSSVAAFCQPEPGFWVDLGAGAEIALRRVEVGPVGVGAADAERYGEYRALMHRFAKVLRPFWLKTMPGIGNNSLSES